MTLHDTAQAATACICEVPGYMPDVDCKALHTDKERIEALADALEQLLRVGFKGDDFLTQNSIPMAATPGVRRALKQARAALAAAQEGGAG